MTTDSAKLVSIFHDIDAEEIAKTERNIEAMYRVFRRRVAESRGWDKLPEAEVEKKLDEVTGGRVFTGVQAKENGLVDELGGIDAAVSRAVQMGLAQRTKLLPDKVRDALTGLATPPEPEIVDIRIYPVQPSFFSLLLGDNNQSLEENLVKLGKQTMTSLARWFVAGHGMWEMEQAMLDAGERAEVSMKAGRGQMAMDAKISL